VTIVCMPWHRVPPKLERRSSPQRSPRTSTRGFAAEGEPGVAVCLLPGTELAFEQDVKHDQGWIWTRTTSFRVAKFGVVEPMCRIAITTRSNFPMEAMSW